MVRVFLRGSDSEPLLGPLGRVVSFIGLDVNGTTLLGRRARVEMKSAALVLAVVFLFDLGAWTLLFNTLLHATIKTVDEWSILAAAGGLLFAVTVLLYERQFYTADISGGWRRVLGPMAVRLFVIGISAVITAQPVELLFFKEAIAQRAHEEGIRLEVVTRRKELGRIHQDLEELRGSRDGLVDAAKKEPEYEQYSNARKQLGQLLVSRSKLEDDIATDERNVGHWRSEAAQRRASWIAARHRDPDEARTAAASLRNAEARQRQWQGRLAADRAELHAVQSQISQAETEVGAAWTRFENRRRQLEEKIEANERTVKNREERIEHWIRQLRAAQPGASEPIAEESQAGDATGGSTSSLHELASPELRTANVSSFSARRFEYRFPDYHFFRQLRVLEDLRKGNPPLWEGISTGEVRALAAQHGLEDVQPCPPHTATLRPGGTAAAPCDERQWQRHRQETRMYFVSWLVVYGVAMVIPALVIAMKFLMPPELKIYYSAAHQALAGNPDAIAYQRILAAGGRSRTEHSAPETDLDRAEDDVGGRSAS